MARYIGPNCRLCRREGTKLFLKGERCYSDKCAIERKRGVPGQASVKRRTKLSDYGLQLREKQKLKRIYSVLEKQFRKFFDKAHRTKGKTGEILVQNLELRLDTLIKKLGFASSQTQARQLVRHNHVLVNNKKCNIPSAILKVGDKVSLKQPSRELAPVLASLEVAKRDGHGVPSWLKFEPQEFLGEIIATPNREEIHIPVKEQLVVELYSK